MILGRKILDARKELADSESLFETFKLTAEAANEEYLMALESRVKAAESLQSHTPDHLSEILRNAEKTRTDAERIKLQSESMISSTTERINILRDRLSELDRQIHSKEQSIEISKQEVIKLEESITKSRELLIDLKGRASQFNEEQQILTQRRDTIVEERASLRASLETKSQNRQTLIPE